VIVETGDNGRSLSYPQLTTLSGERCKLPSGVWGWAPAEAMFGLRRFIPNFCAILDVF